MTKIMINILQLSVGTCHSIWGTYSVVKFIVNVKVVEKRVNSVVGRVIVLKVMTQMSKLGITRRMLKITRPRSPKVETCAGSVDRAFAREPFQRLVVLARTAEALLSADATEFAESMAVTGDGMRGVVGLR
jgi:hypothetical protein